MSTYARSSPRARRSFALLRIVILCTLFVTIGLAAPAAAAEESMRITGATFDAFTGQITVAFTVNCDPDQPGGFFLFDVTVQQGKTGFQGHSYPNCDPVATHTFLTYAPPPPEVRFHAGAAVISVTAYFYYPCPEDPWRCNGITSAVTKLAVSPRSAAIQR